MKGQLYDYYGEKLTLLAIARKENLTRDSLAKNLEKVGDIYEAVKVSKKNKKLNNGYIEYNGKMHSIRSISKLEKVGETSLMKYYNESAQDIYKAVEKAKEAQQKFHGDIFYNGRYMNLANIAKEEDVNNTSLGRFYLESGDIYDAVTKAKNEKMKKHGSVLYKGELLTISAIAKQNGVLSESLRRLYNKLGDIDKALKEAKYNKLMMNGSIEYYGEIMSALEISRKENISYESLRKYYKQTGNIYDAVDICKKIKPLYKGKRTTIMEIARLEGLDRHTLKKYYDLYNDIDKAIQVVKTSMLKRKKAILRGKELTYEALSREFGISVIEIDRLIESGQLVRKVEGITKKDGNKASVLMVDDNTLYKYCLEHSYNYSVIINMIRRYSKTPEEAIKTYVENGQQIPSTWIYEKYDLLFKHLSLKFGMDSDRLVKYIKTYNCSIYDSITKYILRSNNDKYGFEKIEIDWLEELYPFISNIPQDEYPEAKETFFINDKEEKFLKDKMSIINYIKRQVLLYEFAEVLDEWDIEELKEMMNLYELTDQEKENVILDLYSPFNNKVLDPRNSSKERQKLIRDIITNQLITPDMVLNDENLSQNEKNDIIRKKELMLKFFCTKKDDKDRNTKSD